MSVRQKVRAVHSQARSNGICLGIAFWPQCLPCVCLWTRETRAIAKMLSQAGQQSWWLRLGHAPGEESSPSSRPVLRKRHLRICYCLDICWGVSFCGVARITEAAQRYIINIIMTRSRCLTNGLTDDFSSPWAGPLPGHGETAGLELKVSVK